MQTERGLSSIHAVATAKLASLLHCRRLLDQVAKAGYSKHVIDGSAHPPSLFLEDTSYLLLQVMTCQ
jgi:hypothetical protein